MITHDELEECRATFAAILGQTPPAPPSAFRVAPPDEAIYVGDVVRIAGVSPLLRVIAAWS